MRVGGSLGGAGGDSSIIKGTPKGKEGQKEFKPKELTKEEAKVDPKEKEGKPKESQNGIRREENGVKKDKIGGEERPKNKEEEGKKEIKEVTGNVGRGDEQFFKEMDIGETAAIKGTQAVDTSAETRARIDAVNRIITNNVSDLQVNGQGAFLTLKTDSVEIPEVFQGAQVELNLTDEGLTVQFTLAHGASEASAVDLMQKGDLAALQTSLADKGIHLHEMKMGNTNIVLPEVARAEQMAPRSIFEPEGGRRDREGGREGGGGGGREREKEPQK